MSKILTRLLMGFIMLAVMLAAIAALRADLLSGGAAWDAFMAVFDCFPFANETAQVASYIGQYGVTLQGLTPSNFINDVTKIFAMVFVCPLVIGLATKIFLPIPAGLSWEYQEKYMSSFGYRMKQCLINVLLMPVCAWITAKLVDLMLAWFLAKCPFLHPTVAALGLLVALFAAATITQMLESSHWGTIVRTRLIVNLLGGVLKILGLNILSFMIAMAIMTGQAGQVALYGVMLAIYLAAIELMLGALTGRLD